MSDLEKSSDYGDIDESEEEALLRSDGDQTMDCLEASTDDEDEQNEEDKLMTQYIKTLGEIEQNRYNYDNYVQLTETAHKLSDLEKIRQSCELFASVYPLAPEIWLRWLKIETSLATSQTELQYCESLFRKALSDYFSVDVALEFAVLASKLPCDEADQIWEELLSVYALHCMKGRELFVLWRKYYKDNHENLEKTVLTNMYIKELSIPLYDMEESYIEFKVLYEKNKEEFKVNWEDVDKKYNRAKNHLQKILPFEKKLAELDTKAHQERAAVYKEYIKEADNFLDEDVLQIVYERMITDCCLNQDCWLSYMKYLEDRGTVDELEKLEKYFTFKQSPLDINNRALRNCTWSDKLYIKKMQIVEELGSSKAEIKEIFENAIAAGFQTPEPMVTLWLEYLSYIKRHTNFQDKQDVDILRANFDFSWSSLGKQWGVLADCDCQILQFWGRLEYEFLGDFSKGKELWKTVMESSENASKSGLWIEFAHLELKKDIDAARRIFRKALNETTLDNPPVIAYAWLRFERCYGSSSHQITCQEQCEKVLNAYNWKMNKNAKTKAAESKGKIKGTKRRQENVEYGKTDSKEDSPFKKPKLIEGAESQSKPTTKKPSAESKLVKEHEDEEIDLKKDHLRIFLSNLDYNITEKELQTELHELDIVSVDLIKAANGRGRGFGYVELKSEEEVKKALKLDRKMVRGRPLYVSSVLRDKEKRQKFKYSGGLEPTKLFVKGVPYDATKEDLEELFSPFGKLKDVRIVCHKSGKPKGIAYVEYEEESAASAAIMKLDQFEFRGFKLNVAISAPPPRQTKKDEVNINKMLGIGRSRNLGVKGEQKPRMSLIPTVVRKNVASTSQTNGSNAPPEKKTNEDFRKLLNK